MRQSEERLKAEVRKWGNSLGLIIPNKFAERLNLREREVVDIRVKKKMTGGDLMDLFGTLKFREPTDKIIKETKEGWKD